MVCPRRRFCLRKQNHRLCPQVAPIPHMSVKFPAGRRSMAAGRDVVAQPHRRQSGEKFRYVPTFASSGDCHAGMTIAGRGVPKPGCTTRIRSEPKFSSRDEIVESNQQSVTREGQFVLPAGQPVTGPILGLRLTNCSAGQTIRSGRLIHKMSLRKDIWPPHTDQELPGARTISCRHEILCTRGKLPTWRRDRGRAE